jgi:hypothetical protein
MNYSLGIFIDGNFLRAALVSKGNNKHVVEKLETFRLYEQLDQSKEYANGSQNGDKRRQPNAGSDEKALELPLSDFEEQTSSTSISEAQSNLDVISELVHRLCPNRTAVSFNLNDSNVLYKNIAHIKESNITKIKKAIWREFNEDVRLPAKLDHIGFIKHHNTKILGLLHDDPLVLASMLLETNKFSRSNPVNIKLIDTIEFALAYEIKQSYNLEKEGYSAVIVFAKAFTKIFFMHGDLVIAVIPTIDEGSNSETICETVFSKILFEFDSGNIGPLSQLFLVEEFRQANALQFFKRKLPALPVQGFGSNRAIISEDIDQKFTKIEEYGIPISLALKALDRKNLSPYNHNFLPRRIRDKQSVFKIAWHGAAMLFILFACVLFLTHQIIVKALDIKSAEHQVKTMEEEIEDKASVQSELDSLGLKIATLEKTASLLDSLNQNTTRWTPTIETISAAFKDVGPFYLERLETPSAGKLLIESQLSDRKQVAELERFIEKSMVMNVIESEESVKEAIHLKLDCQIKKEPQKGGKKK